MIRRLPALVGIALTILSSTAAAQGAQPPAEATARWGVLADAQSEGDRSGLRAMVRVMQKVGAELLLYAGDTSYGYGDVRGDWKSALGPYASSQRLLFVNGNHDHGDGYREYMPEKPPATWWETTVDGVVVVGLDTNRPLHEGSEQARWLEATLEEHADAFVVVTLHIPWWVPNLNHEPELDFPGDPEHLHDLAQEYDVDLVIGGHEHYYARHERDGVTYVIAGPADAQVRDVPPPIAETAVVSVATETGMVLDVSGCGARAVVITADGAPLDAFDATAVPADTSDGAPVAAAGGSYVCHPGDPVPRSAPKYSFEEPDERLDEEPEVEVRVVPAPSPLAAAAVAAVALVLRRRRG